MATRRDRFGGVGALVAVLLPVTVGVAAASPQAAPPDALARTAPAPGAQPPALAFKGLALGASLVDARRHFGNLRCRPEPAAGSVQEIVCSDDPAARCSPPHVFRIPAEQPGCADRVAALRAFDGTAVSSVSLRFVDARLLRVELGFRSADFDAIVATIGASYGGAGSSESSDVPNRFGTAFRDTVARWSFADGEIVATRLSSDFSRGTVTYSGARTHAEQAARSLRSQPRDL
jgi:hypothetical protein